MLGKITINGYDIDGSFLSIEIPKYFESITIMESAKDLDTTPDYLMIIQILGEDDKTVYFKTKEIAQSEKIRVMLESESS